MDAKDAEQRLIPLLRAELTPRRADIPDWYRGLVERCRQLLSSVLPLSPNERQFLDIVNDQGEVQADLLTDDEVLQARIDQHPGIAWKALNVRRRSDSGSGDDPTPEPERS